MKKLCQRSLTRRSTFTCTISTVYSATLCLPVLIFGICFFGFQSPSCFAAEEVLNNASVIELQTLSLGDAVIVEKIKTSKCDFDTSINGLKQLKAAKLSDVVIQAMVATKAPTAAPAIVPGAQIANGDLNDPLAPHPAGVWVLQEIGGKKKMTQLESELAAAISDGGFIGPFGIGERKQEARLNRAQSELRLAESKPVFLFYLGQTLQGANPDFVNVQNPKDFLLVKFTTKTQSNRELKISSHGAYGGSSGISSEDVKEFAVEKLSEGIFKISPKGDLSSGEYAFCRMTQRPERFATFGLRLANDPEIERLCASLNAKDANVIIDALKQLRGMAGPETVPQILPCLKHSHPNVIRDACRTLAVIGNKDVVPSIEPLLQHAKPDVRKDAQDAINALNSKS